jgi:hypothetical protein
MRRTLLLLLASVVTSAGLITATPTPAEAAGCFAKIWTKTSTQAYCTIPVGVRAVAYCSNGTGYGKWLGPYPYISAAHCPVGGKVLRAGYQTT